MPETMPAFRILDWGRQPRLVEVPVPEPGPGEVLIAVAGNGLCHSDIDMARIPAEVGESIGWRVPFTLGHEIAGHVAGLGAGVTGVAEGDAVALVSAASCGRCAMCERGRESACPDGLAGRGYGRDGGLAPFVVAPAPRAIVPLGGLDPVLAAPLTDAGATSHHAVARVVPRLGEGSTAVVIGVGGLGAFAVQLLRALTPARVVGVDTNPARRAVAVELGAHEAVATVDDALGGGGSADVVLDIVGSDATIAAGLAAVAPFGAFGLVGAGGGSFRRPWFGGLPRDVEIFTFQGSSIADVHAVIDLARDGRITSAVDRYPLSRVADAYAALDAGTLTGRAVVVPGS